MSGAEELYYKNYSDRIKSHYSSRLEMSLTAFDGHDMIEFAEDYLKSIVHNHMNMDPIIVKSLFNRNVYFLFRKDGTEIKIEIINKLMRPSQKLKAVETNYLRKILIADKE